MVAVSTSTTSKTAPTTMAPAVAPAMAVFMASQAEAPPTVAAIAAPIATSNMAPVAPSEAPTGEPTTPSTLGAMGFTLPPASGDVQHSFMKGFFQRKTKVSNNLVVKNAAVMLQQNTPTHFQFINVGIRPGALVPRGGYKTHEGIVFSSFDEFEAEARNFLLSSWGQLASPVGPDGYWVFALKSYKRVNFCKNCKKGGRSSCNHLFECLVLDLEANGRNPVTGPESLDLCRSFDRIRLFKPTATSRFVVPTKIQQTKTMTDLTAEETESLISAFFPSGKIKTDRDGFFHFTITENTPNQGVITEILKSIEHIKSKNFKRALDTIF